MIPDEILDSEFSENFQEYLFEKEGIIWEGNPNLELSKQSVDEEFYPRNGQIQISPITFFLIFVGQMLFIVISTITQSELAGISGVIAGFAILKIRPQIRRLRQKNTRYAFTRNRVFFQLWRWGKRSVHFVDFADVAQITYQEYYDKSGTIHFLPKKSFNFYTYDFENGEKRFYPTFEKIPDVLELHKKLEAVWMERINSKLAGGK